MWTLRRMFQIPRTDTVRKNEVTRKAGIERELFNLIKEGTCFEMKNLFNPSNDHSGEDLGQLLLQFFE